MIGAVGKEAASSVHSTDAPSEVYPNSNDILVHAQVCAGGTLFLTKLRLGMFCSVCGKAMQAFCVHDQNGELERERLEGFGGEGYCKPCSIRSDELPK